MPMEFLSQGTNILLVAIILISGLSLVWPMLSRSGGHELSPAAATQLINRQDALIVDVREADEFAGGHLPEARNYPQSRFADYLGEMEKFKDKPVILCCLSGMRSAKTCGELAKQGFSQVFNLAGGIDAWKSAGYPLQKGGRKK